MKSKVANLKTEKSIHYFLQRKLFVQIIIENKSKYYKMTPNTGRNQNFTKIYANSVDAKNP